MDYGEANFYLDIAIIGFSFFAGWVFSEYFIWAMRKKLRGESILPFVTGELPPGQKLERYK